MRSPAYYKTRTVVRVLFWGTVLIVGMAVVLETLEFLTWNIWYRQPVPEPGNYPLP